MIFETFVGRERELAHLNAVRDEMLRERRGSVVSITGEPGIGKTRLLHEFRAGFGRNVAASAARARDGASLPYSTWQELLSAIAVPQRPVISSALKRAKLAGVDVATADERIAAIVNAVCDVARAADGLIVVIDDVQYCDRASLEALRVLADRIEDHPIVLVIAMRDLDESYDVSRVTALARIERLAGTRVRLLPLSDAYLAPLLARTLTPDQVAPVLRLAEGRPFAAEELGRAAASRSASGSIPLSLSAAILERLDRLPTGAREILVRAAVLGRDFTLEDLAHVTEADESRVLAALRSARDEHLIAEDPDSVTGAFRFRHALTREALYRTLLRVEATRMHTAVADRLVADAPERIVEIAFHRWSAGDAERAPAACKAAAERATALGAPGDAVEHYLRALSFDSMDAATIVAVIGKVATILRSLYREDEAYNHARAARLRIDTAQYPIEASRAISVEALQAGYLQKFEESNRLFELAEHTLKKVPESAVQRHERAFIARARTIIHHADGRLEEARAQLQLTHSLDLDVAGDDSLKIVGSLLLFEDGKIADSLAMLERYVARDAKFENATIGALNLAYAYWYLGLFDQARETTQRMSDIARTHGHQAYAQTATAFKHLIDATRGYYRDALDYVGAQPPVEPATRLLLPTLRANLFLWKGIAPAAQLERDIEAVGPTQVNATLFAGAMAWKRANEPASARDVVRRFLMTRDRYAFDYEDAAIAFAAEDVAHERLARLERLAQIPEHRAARAYALLGRARLAERTSRSIEAARYGREAATAFAELGAPVQRARAAWIAGDFDEARDALCAIGATGELARLEGRTSDTKAPSQPLLSRREEQVARAAAGGASLKAIAVELGISVRTAESHLRNAYAKLDVRTRLELARRLAER